MRTIDSRTYRTVQDGPSTTSRRRGTTAALALAAGPVLLAAEATAALAWDSPASCSCGGSWTSDLGVPVAGVVEGRAISPPLHDLLDAPVTDGALLLVGVALLPAVLPTGTRTRLRMALVAVAATGFAATGVFHTCTAAAQDGTVA